MDNEDKYLAKLRKLVEPVIVKMTERFDTYDYKTRKVQEGMADFLNERIAKFRRRASKYVDVENIKPFPRRAIVKYDAKQDILDVSIYDRDIKIMNATIETEDMPGNIIRHVKKMIARKDDSKKMSQFVWSAAKRSSDKRFGHMKPTLERFAMEERHMDRYINSVGIELMVSGKGEEVYWGSMHSMTKTKVRFEPGTEKTKVSIGLSNRNWGVWFDHDALPNEISEQVGHLNSLYAKISREMIVNFGVGVPNESMVAAAQNRIEQVLTYMSQSNPKWKKDKVSDLLSRYISTLEAKVEINEEGSPYIDVRPKEK